MSATSERLVLVHGFTQTAHSWRAVASLLEDRLRPEPTVLLVDAPGHGSKTDVRAGLVEGAAMLGDECGRATYIGYSMGGRLCLHLALARPDLVDRLVLLGVSPGIEDPTERDERREADEQLAEDLESLGLDAFLDRWLRNPLFARLPRAAADMEHRRSNSVEGLASSLRLAGTGVQEPLWDRLHELAMPVLAMAGAHDEKFTSLGIRLASMTPDATFMSIPDAGHSAHLERPDEVGAAIVRWLAAHPPSASPSANVAP